MPDEFMHNRARELRKNMTLPERVLWKYLRGSFFAGLKFRHQHPIGHYVADFCCVQEKLIIELDGESHDFTEQQDKIREEYLQSQNFRVLRFSNNDVFENVDAVLMTVAKELNIDWKEASLKSNWKR